MWHVWIRSGEGFPHQASCTDASGGVEVRNPYSRGGVSKLEAVQESVSAPQSWRPELEKAFYARTDTFSPENPMSVSTADFIRVIQAGLDHVGQTGFCIAKESKVSYYSVETVQKK